MLAALQVPDLPNVGAAQPGLTTGSDALPREVVWAPALVTRPQREHRQQHKGLVVWFTGLSGSGKSTLAAVLEQRLHTQQIHTYWLDGDNVRHGLCADLGFSMTDRRENLRRVAETARLMVDAGLVVIASFISPLHADRKLIQSIVGAADFLEVFCDTPLSVCEHRDVKGMYAKARSGTIPLFTGISSPYERPEAPDVHLYPDRAELPDLVAELAAQVQKHISPAVGALY